MRLFLPPTKKEGGKGVFGSGNPLPSRPFIGRAQSASQQEDPEHNGQHDSGTCLERAALCLHEAADEYRPQEKKVCSVSSFDLGPTIFNLYKESGHVQHQDCQFLGNFKKKKSNNCMNCRMAHKTNKRLVHAFIKRKLVDSNNDKNIFMPENSGHFVQSDISSSGIFNSAPQHQGNLRFSCHSLEEHPITLIHLISSWPLCSI